MESFTEVTRNFLKLIPILRSRPLTSFLQLRKPFGSLLREKKTFVFFASISFNQKTNRWSAGVASFHSLVSFCLGCFKLSSCLCQSVYYFGSSLKLRFLFIQAPFIVVRISLLQPRSTPVATALLLHSSIIVSLVH